MQQLVVATYERFLLGYQLPQALEEGCELKRTFTYAAHQGPVRCLDAAGPFLVSGGQDDQLHLYDLQAGKDLGFVMNPADGAIPCLALYTPPGTASPSHLFSGSDDGSIAIWQAGGGWQHLKLMRGHKGPVRGLSVHPSGRIALSVGADRGLRMWHLGKGRCSYTAKLEVQPDSVAFGASGETYALLCDRLITLHAVGEEGALLARLQHERRACCMLQATDGASLLSGVDDGSVLLWDVRAPGGPAAALPRAHANRVRAITAVTPGGPAGLPLQLASASSDGVVKLWDARRLGSSSSTSNDGTAELQELASVSTSGRITGMVLSAPGRVAPGQLAAGDEGGDAAAAADAQQQGGEAPRKKKKKQQQQQQQQQQGASKQQQLPAKPKPSQEAGQLVPPKQQQQKQQQKQQQPPQAADGDTALVPRVNAKLLKKKAQPPQAADGDTALVPRVNAKLLKKKAKAKQQPAKR